LTGSYRASYLANYLLGALAVALAASGWAVGEQTHSEVAHVAFGVSELACIAAVLSITRASRQNNWHRWGLDMRLLAEWLRQYRFHFVSVASRVATPWIAYLANYKHPLSTWMNWLLGAVQRQAGLPSVELDGPTLQAVFSWVLEAHLRRQAKYHQDIAEVVEVANRNLRMSSSILFGVAAGCVLLHFHFRSHWLVVGSIAFPAFATALAAVRSHSEMESVVNRSVAMHEHLNKLSSTFQTLDTSAGCLSFLRLREAVFLSTSAMNDEVVGWITSFADRPVELP
jgi:hypothetical protein